MDTSKFKKLLLRSGIPLEASVVKKLKDLEIDDMGEIEYERDGKIFSTDIFTFKEMKFIENISLSLNFTIECKYRERNHIWVFMKFPEGEFSGRVSSLDLFFDDLLLEALSNEETRDKLALYSYTLNYLDIPKVSKGIELILDKDRMNPSSISEAVSQVVFGSIASYREWIEITLDEFYLYNKYISDIKEESYLLFFRVIPTIITTSTLMKIKDGVSMEEIEKSDNPLEFCEEVPAVSLKVNMESITKKFRKEIFNKYPIDDDLKYNVETMLGWNQGRVDEIIHTANDSAIISPGHVFIINYYKMNDTISKIVEDIENMLEKMRLELYDIPEKKE